MAATTQLASDHALDRRVTVRVFGPLASSERGRKASQRLARELRTLTSLRHPAAPRIFDVLERDDHVVVVMEPIEVSSVLQSLPAPNAALAVQVARELLGVLAQAHELGVIHRAVTASALAAKRVDPERGAIKLLGWGRLADLGEVPTAPGEDGVGLDAEWAPETILGDTVDPRTDVYGVGTVAFRLLTGRPLLDVPSDKPDAVMRELLRTNRSIRLEGVQASLRDWVHRCLAIAPESRFGSAKEALEALPTTEVRSGSVVQTRPQPRMTPGGIVGNGYRILDVLGRGGMGTVYLAEDLALERRVALKLLHDLRADARDRLMAEARSLGRVRSPNVVHVYAVGEEAGVPFLVMEHVTGASLEDVLAGAPRGLPLARVRDVAEGIGRGLRDLHALEMVHGDVKPSNVMQDGDRVFLLDFGLVRGTDAFDRSQREGTPAYMAPERIRGEVDPDLAPAIDQYATAVLLHELLTGALPFEGTSIDEMLDRHLNAPPATVASRRPGLGPEVDAVLARGLAKDPAARFPTIESFVEAFVRALDVDGDVLAPLSVLVVGDDPERRGRVARTLGEHLGVRAVHQAPRRASIPVARKLEPDVAIVLDDDTAQLERAVLMLSRTFPTCAVVAVAPSPHTPPSSLTDVGAAAVMPASSRADTLRHALRTALRR
ncbi:MAG: serine/threonine-protein kinase [Polyangiales bacterium]